MATAAVPIRRTQAERTALSESRILRAAVRLIAKRGYSKTTLADIGEAAGYSRGLVGHRFGSKEGLLQRLVPHLGGRFIEDQLNPALHGRIGLEALEVMVDTYLNELVVREEKLHALYVLMGEALGPVSEIRPVFARFNASTRDIARAAIEAGIAAGKLRSDIDPSTEVVLFLGMLRGAAMQWVTDPGCFEIDRLGASMKAALRDHLAPRDATVAKRESGKKA